MSEITVLDQVHEIKIAVNKPEPADYQFGDSLQQEKVAVTKVQAGDKNEFRELVLRYKDMVYGMIKRQINSHDVAEEITQEVFVKAYLNISKFRFESKFSTWLIRIALNQTNSYFSTKKFRQQQMTESFDKHTHDISDSEKHFDLENEKAQSELLQRFKEALSRLKPTFRDVLVLCGLEGRSYQEAAEVLDIPIGTVRSRLNKARLLVKHEMQS